MSLLSVAQNVATDLGLRQPPAIVGSTDPTAIMLLRLANKEGESLSRWHEWQALVNEVTFTTLAQEIQTDALDPDTYGRMVRNAEVWNRSLNLRYSGPTPQRYWQRAKASNTTTGFVGNWRILLGQLHIYPVPTAGQTLAFEIVTKNWVSAADATPQAAYMADTDESILPERLIELGMLWRYRQGRGFPQYAEDMETYEREKELEAAADRGSGRVRPENTSSSNTGLNDPIWNGQITG